MNVKIKTILYIVFLILAGYLLTTVLLSGLHYTYDIDEYFHIQSSYLLTKGFLPHRDFFSPYSVLFSSLIAPIRFLSGFTEAFLYNSRLVMIGLYIVRLIVTFYITKQLFGKRAGCIAVLFILLDPIQTFTGMQIRPDVLALTLVAAGVALVCKQIKNDRLSGTILPLFLFGLSLLVSIKIVPFVVGFVGYLCLKLRRTHRTHELLNVVFFLFFPILAYGSFFGFAGAGFEPFRQLFIDAIAINKTLQYPQNLLNAYWPENPYLFGYRQSALWIFTVALIMGAISGMYSHLISFFSKDSNDNRKQLQTAFFVGSFFQIVSLFTIHSVFMQYLLPAHWIFSIFGAYAVVELIRVSRPRGFQTVMSMIFIIGLLVVYKQSIRLNLIRSHVSGNEYLQTASQYWKIIPNETYVFPGLLFRRSVYPIGFGWNRDDLPDMLLTRFGSIETYLQQKNNTIIIYSEPLMKSLSPATKDYIQKNYHALQDIESLYVRNVE